MHTWVALAASCPPFFQPRSALTCRCSWAPPRAALGPAWWRAMRGWPAWRPPWAAPAATPSWRSSWSWCRQGRGSWRKVRARPVDGGCQWGAKGLEGAKGGGSLVHQYQHPCSCALQLSGPKQAAPPSQPMTCTRSTRRHAHRARGHRPRGGGARCGHAVHPAPA